METTQRSTKPLTFRALWHEKSTQRSYIKTPLALPPHLTPSPPVLAEAWRLWFRDLRPFLVFFPCSIRAGCHSQTKKVDQGETRRHDEPPSVPSDLRLQVDDILPHQRDGGARLLPLHRVVVPGRGGEGFQVLADPCRGRLWDTPDSLPRPVQRSLLFVLWKDNKKPL